MAKERRVLRLQQLILETVAETVQQGLDDPRIGMVSVTRVKLSPDLTAARVYWSCLGTDAQRRTSERGLQRALPLLQRAVAQSMGTRVTPRLSLTYDETLARSERLEEIFERLRRERGESPTPDDASPPPPSDDDE
jgi:ribosome-binding factor A